MSSRVRLRMHVAVLLECSGAASPDRDSSAEVAVSLVEEHIHDADAHVRRCALFLLSRVLLVGAGDVASRPFLQESLDVLILREADETCRKMAMGIVTWLQHRHFASWPGISLP